MRIVAIAWLRPVLIGREIHEASALRNYVGGGAVLRRQRYCWWDRRWEGRRARKGSTAGCPDRSQGRSRSCRFPSSCHFGRGSRLGDSRERHESPAWDQIAPNLTLAASHAHKLAGGGSRCSAYLPPNVSW